MVPRHAMTVVERALHRLSAVGPLGPRQVGKTTLARAVADLGVRELAGMLVRP